MSGSDEPVPTLGGLHDFVKSYNGTSGGLSPRNEENMEVDDEYKEYDRSFNSGNMASSMAFVSPITFTKPSSEEVVETEEDVVATKPTNSLSALQVESMTQSANQLRQRKDNSVNGRKYGIGAALLKKMGYIEGKGLGLHNQGITEPIEQKYRKPGTGLGESIDKKKTQPGGALGDEEDQDVSSDEEYYKGVAKKSLFQITKELIEFGIDVPEKLKELSNNETLQSLSNDELKVELNDLVDELNDKVLSISLIDQDEKMIERQVEEVDLQIAQYAELKTKLVELDNVLRNNDDVSVDIVLPIIQSFTETNYSQIPEFSYQKEIIRFITPNVKSIIHEWKTQEFLNEDVFNKLAIYYQITPDELIPDELNHWDSLMYSELYPKFVDSFRNWDCTAQGDELLKMINKWTEIIDSAIIEKFINTDIIPKIVAKIEDWRLYDEVTPFDWIGEYIAILRPQFNKIKVLFLGKYETFFDEFEINNFNFDGLKLIEYLILLDGDDDEIMELINRKIIPKLCKRILEFKFYESEDVQIITKIFNWNGIIDFNQFVVLLQGFLNQFKYQTFKELRNKSKLSRKLKKWINEIFKYVVEFQMIEVELREVLDMINNFIDTEQLFSVHDDNLLKYEEFLKTVRNINNKTNTTKPTSSGVSSNNLQVSFKEYLESYCNKNDLFLFSMKNNLLNGNSLFKISSNFQGKNGINCYISEDVLYVEINGEFKPVSINSLSGLLVK